MLHKLISGYRKNIFFSIPLFRITRDSIYKDTIRLLKESEHWNHEQVEKWQLEHIIEIVEYAYNHVPYYHKIYSDAGYSPGDLKTLNDFKKLPCVTKDDIKLNLKEFCSDEINQLQKINSHTGGSTDKPMSFWVDKNLFSKEMAYYDWYWGKYGYQCGKRCIILRGNRISNFESEKLYYYDRLPNYKIFDSSFLDNLEKLKLYDKQIRDFHADFIQAYPSSIYALAKNYISMGIEAPKFKFIFLSSENIFEPQLKVIQQVFGCKKIAYSYGHTEMVVLAFKYADSNELGFMPLYGFAELLNSSEKDIHDTSTIAEIVGTSWSKVMPFIRYRTGDYATSSNYHENGYLHNCMSIARVDGRKQEFIYTENGSSIPLVIIAGAHIPSLSLIGDMQYYQKEAGKLDVYLTTSNKGTAIPSQVISKIKNDLEERLHFNISITIHQVDKIKKTIAGKRIMLLKKPLI